VEESAELASLVMECVERPLEFVEIRNCLERRGMYVDGVVLRKVVAELVRRGLLCREVSRNRILFYRCGA